ncbi:MAG TPA: hypothetical protein ENI26_06315 [Methylophaga aminisulfidivorans]|uniref:Uncharacterized protein n=2 Tax=root TaxID=1 RepID=A0A7C2A6Z0_9GAMM|nr:hypothetical protein [Methylophaga aminisulfidivorans]
MTDKNCTSLTYTVPNAVGMGGRTFPVTRTLIREVSDWAQQIDSEDGESLSKAMKDLDSLLVTCWTEIDESLTWLNLCEHHLNQGSIDDAKEQIKTAKSYLNRWQDRGGVHGNAFIPQQSVSLETNDTKQKTDNFQTLNDLQARLAQASAMMMIHQSEDYENWNDEIKENYAWACSEMVDQAKQLANELTYK